MSYEDFEKNLDQAKLMEAKISSLKPEEQTETTIFKNELLDEANFGFRCLFYRNGRRSRIIKNLLDLAFLYLAVFLAQPGVVRLIELLQSVDIKKGISSLVIFWFIVSNIAAIPYFFLFNKRGYRYVHILSIASFIYLIICLGLLGYELKYLYFLAVYLIGVGFIRFLPIFHRQYSNA